MFKDAINDSNKQLFHVLKTQFLDGKLPDFVKQEEYKLKNLPLNAFADPVDRAFPVHTKAAAYISSLYFHGQLANNETWSSSYPLTKASERLASASQFWGIDDDITQLINATQEKSAAPEHELTDDDYALNVKYADETIKRFPIANQAMVIKAAKNLNRDKAYYPYKWRKEAATKILKRASDLSAQLDQDELIYLSKAAGLFPSDKEQAAKRLRHKSLLFSDEAKTALRKAADAIQCGTNTVALCKLLDGVDRKYRKSAAYVEELTVSENLLFDGPQIKQAKAPVEVKLTTGKKYPLDKIKQAGLEPFTILGPEYLKTFADNDKGDLNLTKISEILPTIPLDDAKRLDKSFKAVGVLPISAE